ncbi:hypothetical protein DFQ27_007342 [Actinomortierella ambigua]|uniref:Ras GEF n=1 Tax=Actinomortierella ambigua TaxID=1343610 RepID=A0A9P6U065_9FUNG|nr:hypothetical protein DFQ27_007342 [Actinomortierella ambigua]
MTNEVVSESLEVQVLVRALYDFQSDDATNLTFRKDDVIQVLAQLESGWWAGNIDGRQGWFPSNYVQIIGEDDLEYDDDPDDANSADDLWLPQTTPDGQVFYYNQRTHESAWTIPESEDRASLNTADTPNQDGSGHQGWSVRQSTSNGNGWYNSEAEEDDQDQDQDEEKDHDHAQRALSRASSTRSSAHSLHYKGARDGGDASSTTGSAVDNMQSHATVRKPSGLAPGLPQESVEGLPPLPTLPNPFDPEPTWTSLSEHTSAAVQNLIHSTEQGYKPYYLVQSSIVVEAIRVMLYASGTVDKDATVMRQHRGLKMHHRQIMAALSKLVLSAKMASGVWPPADAVAKLQTDAREVGTAAQNYVATAMAAGITVHQVDARLVTDVKSPLKTKANNRSLDRALSNGSLRSETAASSSEQRKVLGSQMNTQSILSQLDYYAKSASKAINVLAMQIEKLIDNPTTTLRNSGLHGSTSKPVMSSAQSAQLVAQARQTISQLGSLLTLVTDFSTSCLQEPSTIPEKYFTEVRTTKQALHGATASLVMAVQSATDLLAVGQTLDLALNTTLATEKSTLALVQATRALIQEKETSDATAPLQQNQRLNAGFPNNRKPSVASNEPYNHDNDSDIEPDLARPPTSLAHNGNNNNNSTNNLNNIANNLNNNSNNFRSRSDSQPSLFSSHSNHSGPQTPGTEYSGRTLQGPQSGYPFPHTGEVPGVPGGRDKLKKILGDEAPTRSLAQAWYLGYDYQPNEIVFNPDGQVKGGTLNALVERLTLHDGLDSSFMITFLLTYRSFTNTRELFTLLFRRFNIQAPMGLDSEELEIWTEKKQTPIRLRVFNIIKSWLETYYLEDESDDREALAMIKDFSRTPSMKDTMSFAAVQLIKLVEKREVSDGSLRKMVLNLSTQAPPPITPRNLKKIRFLEIDPLEFARQLTIMEANVYNKIRPVECLAKAWTSEDREIAAKAVNIKKMIETSNLYSNWINELVLSEREIKKRVMVIRQLVSIAEKLRQLNNFSMLSATIAALSLSPIHRLKRTWEQVPTRTMSAFMDLQQLMGVAKNWAEYREELHSVNPPCVPYVGMYLTDLVMIQDGNSDCLKKSNNLINFYKRGKTAEVIREIQQYQSVPYCLTVVPEIQAFIRRGLDCTKSISALYDMSLQLEPREDCTHWTDSQFVDWTFL